MRPRAVSYTHLDVYKRQGRNHPHQGGSRTSPSRHPDRDARRAPPRNRDRREHRSRSRAAQPARDRRARRTPPTRKRDLSPDRNRSEARSRERQAWCRERAASRVLSARH
ncbi:hypothetical protein [Streptomyces fragilis]|uniref:hypothetical protein n=1 Tax=Streptomyces fragilis TaxID=67301 RepID=UPI0024DE5756|nr:hypothetical protein [Streptomyces fragilis]